MSSIIIVISGIIIVLMILAKIPGVEQLIKPIWESLSKVIIVISHWLFLWGFSIIRGLYNSHKVFLINLITPRATLNPKEKVEARNRRKL